MNGQQPSQPVQPQPAQPTKVVPTPVKVIAVLAYIGAALGVLGGIGLLVGGGTLGTAIATQVPLIGVLGGTFFAVAGIIAIVLGVLYFFIGKGLWRGRNWARILVIIFSCIGVLSGIYSLAQGQGGYVGLVIYAVIGGYLWFSKSVKEAFA